MRKNRFQKKKTSSLKKKVFGGLFFCLLAGLVYFLIWSPVLWIEKIEFRDSPSISEGLSLIVQKNLEEKLWRFIPQKSIILAPKNKIKEEILDSFPKIKAVVVNKKLPQLQALASLTEMAGATIEVIIEERKSIGIWCQIEEIMDNKSMTVSSTTSSDEDVESQDQTMDSQPKIKGCFYIDKEGIVFKESPLISGSMILNIFSSKKQSVELRNEVVSPETIDFILTINKELPKIKTVTGPSWQILDFKIISPGDLRVSTSQRCQIYFNPTYSVDSQLKSLGLTLEKEIKENWSSLEYIDLRIEGRVYYK